MTGDLTLPASVIVPSRGRPRMLVECVQSILAGDPLPREVVVVDQSDEENRILTELGTVRGCAIRYRHERSTGVSAARNKACAIASEDILLFTDDDVLVAPTWVGASVDAVLEDLASTLISGRVLPVADGRTAGIAPSLMEVEEPRIYEGRIWNDVLFSNNMGFARSVFDHLGPFDTRLGVGGPYRSATDNDYGFRALEMGYRIRYAPEAVVYHRAWRSKKRYRQLQWAYGVGQGAYLTKHVRVRDRYTLIRLRNEFLTHSKMTLQRRSGHDEVAGAELTYVVGLVYGAARWTVMERMLPRARADR